MLTINNAIRVACGIIAVICILSFFDVINGKFVFYTTPLLVVLILISWMRTRSELR